MFMKLGIVRAPRNNELIPSAKVPFPGTLGGSAEAEPFQKDSCFEHFQRLVIVVGQ
jgi:hypothetical protein